MNTPCDNTIATSAFCAPSRVSEAADRRLSSDRGVRLRQRARKIVQSEKWDKRSERWGLLMVAAQAGERQAYEQLLGELDAWLRRYYACRLPRPAAQDATQEALLAIHAKRHTYAPSRSFGAWVMAIARYKWIDCLRRASRFASVSLDDEVPAEDQGEAVMCAAALDSLLSQLKPAQASVIRLVKLRGLSIERASSATGPSVALVKINIHRGLKKLATLVAWRQRELKASASTGE